MTRIVLVFDVCSSTAIMENLVQNDRVPDYGRLVDAYWGFLHACKAIHHFAIYKFLGDGFILLFEDREHLDDVLEFCNKLVYFSDGMLESFKHSYLDIAKLPRQGITVGIAVGRVAQIESINVPNEEYVGRAINVACRLQKSLTDGNHVNKVLLNADAYRRLEGHLVKKACKETTRSLKDVSGNKEIRCYEYDPHIILNQRWEALRRRTNETEKILRDPSTKKTLSEQLKNIQELAGRLVSAGKKKTWN